MPTPTRQFRATDEQWFPALEKAEADGDSLPDILRDALDRYNAGISDGVPDAVGWIVRSRPPSTNKRVKQPWNYSTPLPEVEARRMYGQMKRAMAKHSDGHEVQLIRRADYVIEQT
jgi:hypothetical protein